ncbi:MAG: PQQ-binding-like beta-propeller repeat protein [Verrucomicrobiales bacterium]
MNFTRLFCLASLGAALSCGGSVLGASIDPLNDWPGWRGPTHDGIAANGQQPPAEWSESGTNIIWKSVVPGRGHGSPTVVADRVYLATADPVKASQSVLCFDRSNGKLLWQTEVHESGADPGNHANSSAASSTIASDGERLYINFLNNGAVHTSALTLDGKVAWQTKISDFNTHQGFAASPIIHRSLVIVSADNRGGGAVAGVDKITGKIVWSEPRPKIPNYTSPAVVLAAGKTQMVLAGCNLVTSLDPMTGKKLWEINGSTEECVGSVVSDGVRVFVTGGYPKNHVAAIAADGSGKVEWQNNTRVYVPTMIVKEDHLYAVLDAGMAVCWNSATGEEKWKERLGGDFFASPVMVDDRVYASNTSGVTYVFQASPENFKLLSKNKLGDETYASPAICGERIYLRVADRNDSRQEFLYCIGESKEK